MFNSDVEYVYDRVEISTEVRILNVNPEDNPGESGVYVVQPGDSLWLIARRFGMTVEELAANNHIEPPYLIYPGQKLYLGRGTQLWHSSAKKP
jgi:LysM repeat protein